MRRTKAWAAAGLLLAASIALSGCGFRPLYAQPGVVSNLTAVDVVAPEGRAGFLLRQRLDDTLARNHDAAPAYRMNLTVRETRYPRGVRIDNVATRYEYVLTAGYTLSRLPNGEVAHKGVVRVELTYDSADQPYAAIAAHQDAEERAAQEAARRIGIELAAWLAEGGKPEAAKS